MVLPPSVVFWVQADPVPQHHVRDDVRTAAIFQIECEDEALKLCLQRSFGIFHGSWNVCPVVLARFQ